MTPEISASGEGPAVDGMTPPAPVVPRELPPEQVKSAKKRLLTVVGAVYGLFVLWLLVLLVLLPSPTGSFEGLPLTGALSAMTGAAVLVLAATFLFLRIARADVSIAVRRRSTIKLAIVFAPGILLGLATPLLITREPALAIDITYPTKSEDMVAPLAVTLSAERSVQLLVKRGRRPVLFTWDYDGDGKPNEETVLPVTTALYERPGSYETAARVTLDDGSTRRLTRRVVIPRAVFSVSPMRPTVETPVRFGLSHLFTQPDDLVEAKWDFDGDGTVDQVATVPDVIHTYYSVGRVPVAVTVTLANQTQATYQRTVTIEKPVPLPFPVTLVTEPKNLIGPLPFGAVFKVETAEPMREIQWTFGDGTEERGADLRRVGHSFSAVQVYPVTVRVRSASGALAEVTTLVRVTQDLPLPDLVFDGSPEVQGDSIRAEVPVTIQLTARSAVPLVEFLWEAPNAANVHATGATVQAVYRKEGTYSLTLVGQDPQGRSTRRMITIEAMPPSAEPQIMMMPAGGTAPLKVIFDASATFIPAGEAVAGFEWTFGDETQGLKPELGSARIEHTYQTPGEYIIKLRVVMESGKEFSTERTIVVRKPVLSACILPSRDIQNIHSGEGIRFEPCTLKTGVTYLWDIRKADEKDRILAQSNEPKYPYPFESMGTYIVRLTVRDSFGNESSETLTITVQP